MADSASSASGLANGLAPLRIRNFRLFWGGFVISNTGRWMELTGAVWLASELTDSAAVLGLIGLARGLPALALGPIAGVLADRIDQRKVILLTQSLSIVASIVMSVLIIASSVQTWHVLTQVAIQSVLNSFDGAARLTLFPRLVPSGLLPQAVTLNAIAGRTSKMIGPTIAGLVIATWGEAAPFLINTLTFPFLMIAVILIRDIDEVTSSAGSTFRGELIEGMRYLWNDPVLRGILQLEVVFGFFSVDPVIITIIAKEYLGAGPSELGVLIAAPALGSVLGIAGLIGFGHSKRSGRFLVLSAVAYAICTILLAGVASIFPAALVTLAAIGLFDALVTVTRHSVMQIAAPPNMRGRVIGNMGTITRGVTPLGELQSGLMAQALGARGALVIAGGAILVASAVTTKNSPGLWQFTIQR